MADAKNLSTGGYPPEWMPNCNSIESLLLNKSIEILFLLFVIIQALILIGIGLLVRQYIRCKIVLHGNLFILFANIIFLYFLYTFAYFVQLIRYGFLLFTYTHPCQMLTPNWLVALFIGPYYTYLCAFPAFHFFIMVERFRAIFLAENYEFEGNKFGIKISIIIWIISLLYTVYIILSAFADTQQFMYPQGLLSLTSKYNGLVTLCVTIAVVPIVLLTAFCDWRITVMNREVKKNFQYQFGHYSLSRQYQLNENELTMRLILPLDISCACLYSVFNSLVIVLRAYKSNISINDYIFYYFFILMLSFIYILAAIIVYIQFLRYVSRNCKRYKTVNVKQILPNQSDEMNVYFKQLNEQWS